MSNDIVTRLRRDCMSLIADEAADEIDRKNLTIKALTEERDECVRMANKLTTERDEATRLLHAMVEHIYETTPTDKNPKHTCDFDHLPERGACKFCENWTAANVLLYGEEYGKENTHD